MILLLCFSNSMALPSSDLKLIPSIGNKILIGPAWPDSSEFIS